MDLTHLAGRCGTCRHWNCTHELGGGYCELTKVPDAPIKASDFGSIQTRIDFGCLWHEVAP